MPGLEIRPFAEEHLDDAAALLAARHARHRVAEPLLPEPSDFRSHVEEAWLQEGASGAIALRGQQHVGYLFGAPRERDVWGANVWVELAGHAVEDPEVVRDLYASAAGQWVEESRTRQYAIVPASEAALVDAWFRLGFGQQHAFGIRELPEVPGPFVGVREAEERDLDALVELAPLVREHQGLSPVFSPGPALHAPHELRRETAEELTSPDIGNLVAEADGRIVGNFVVVPAEMSTMHSGLARPDAASFLGWAATRPDVRGTGVGVALTNAAFAWAKERGYRTMVTDWRVTNLLSSRFWPGRGFRTSFLRLYRSIP
jgi:GNAT superfamily N-acetyltransferase